MKKLVLAILLLGTSLLSYAEIVTVPIPGAPGLSVTVGTGVNALPLQNIQNNPSAVNITTGDDSWNNVPLGFQFPYYGKTFNNSWAMTNGMITFVDPARSGIYGACCEGVNLTTTRDQRWNYSIFAVHSDLFSWNGQNQYYLRETDTMTYGWYNLSQCCNSQGGNSFEIKITAAGTVDTRIAGALVNWNAVTSGMSGDLAQGEYYQFYHGRGINITGTSWNTDGGFTGSDPCITNPLSSPACAGYAVAYLSQQCTISALYNPSCPGYAAAYFTQQCSDNPLYNNNCPGYASAYFTQQCLADPLYNRACVGYEDAYYSQQCLANPLYDTGCSGYASAYLNYRCDADSLYSTQCSGYASAYFAQQCTISGLYSRDCPNYGEAYSLANIVAPAATAAPVQQTIVNTTNVAAVAIIADPVINNIVTSTTTSASPAVAVAPVPLTAPVAAPVMNAAPVESSKSESKKESDSKDSDSKESKSESKKESSSSETKSSSSSETKSSGQTTREQAVAKRKELAAQAAAKAGAEAANNLDSATSLAAQVAVQNVLIAAMGYTPGFQAYSYIMPDGAGYKPFSIYNNQKTVDNKRLNAGLTGASDRLHQQMIDLQYEK